MNLSQISFTLYRLPKLAALYNKSVGTSTYFPSFYSSSQRGKSFRYQIGFFIIDVDGCASPIIFAAAANNTLIFICIDVRIEKLKDLMAMFLTCPISN